MSVKSSRYRLQNVPWFNYNTGKRLEKGPKGKSVFPFQTIDSVVTNDSLQALVRQFYGLTIAYDEVTYKHQ